MKAWHPCRASNGTSPTVATSRRHGRWIWISRLPSRFVRMTRISSAGSAGRRLGTRIAMCGSGRSVHRCKILVPRAHTRPIVYLLYMKRFQNMKCFIWWPALLLMAAGASFGQQPPPPGQGTPASGRGGLPGGGRGPGGGAPQGPPPTYANLDYAPQEPATSNGHKLDLYIPAGATRPLPVVIWTGGLGLVGRYRQERGRRSCRPTQHRRLRGCGRLDPIQLTGAVPRPTARHQGGYSVAAGQRGQIQLRPRSHRSEER